MTNGLIRTEAAITTNSRLRTYKYACRLFAAASITWCAFFSYMSFPETWKTVILLALFTITALSWYLVHQASDHSRRPFADNIASPNHPSNLALKEAFIVFLLAIPLALLGRHLLL